MNVVYILYEKLMLIERYMMKYFDCSGDSEDETLSLYLNHIQHFNPTMIDNIVYERDFHTFDGFIITITCNEKELLRHKLLYSVPQFNVGHGILTVIEKNQLYHMVYV